MSQDGHQPIESQDDIDPEEDDCEIRNVEPEPLHWYKNIPLAPIGVSHFVNQQRSTSTVPLWRGNLTRFHTTARRRLFGSRVPREEMRRVLPWQGGVILTGLPGSGKTTRLVQHALNVNRSLGWDIATNIEGLDQRCAPGTNGFYFVTLSDLRELLEKRRKQLPHQRRFTLLAVDEASSVWPARQYQNFDPVAQYVLQQQRKMKIAIALTSIRYEDIDAMVRRLLVAQWECRFIGWRGVFRYELWPPEEERTELDIRPVKKVTIRYRHGELDAFDTAAIVETQHGSQALAAPQPSGGAALRHPERAQKELDPPQTRINIGGKPYVPSRISNSYTSSSNR